MFSEMFCRQVCPEQGGKKFSTSSKILEFGNAFYFLLGQSKGLLTFIYETYSVETLPQYKKMLWSCDHSGFHRVSFRVG